MKVALCEIRVGSQEYCEKSALGTIESIEFAGVRLVLRLFR